MAIMSCLKEERNHENPAFLCKRVFEKLEYEDMETRTDTPVSRDYILCFIVQFTFTAVFSILIPTIPVYLSRFEAKEAEIGFLIGIFSISSLALRPIVGRALLKIPERTFMLGGSLLYVLSSVAYLLAPPFWPLLLVRLIHGIGLALFSTAIFTLVARIIPENHRGRLISYFYLSNNLSFAVGPYFGMLIINNLNFVVLFLVCAALSLVSLFLTLKLSKEKAGPIENRALKVQTIVTREVLSPSVIAFMLNVIWTALSAFFPLYALKHGVTNPGIFFIFLALTLIFGRVLGARILDTYDRRKMIFPCLITIIVALTLLIFSTTLPLFIAVAVILGSGWALLYPSLMIFAIESAGPAQGPAMGTFTAIADLGAGIGPMIMGIVLQWTSYPVMYLSLSLIGVINFLYFYYAIWKKIPERSLRKVPG